MSPAASCSTRSSSTPPLRRTWTSKAAGVWNFSVFLGALAVREDRRALYHRYCLALPGKLTAGECAVMAESILTTILHYIAQFQEDALALAGGMTLEELASAGS